MKKEKETHGTVILDVPDEAQQRPRHYFVTVGSLPEPGGNDEQV